MSDIIYNSAATGTSERFDVRKADIPTSIKASGVASTDTVNLQFSQDSGATFVDWTIAAVVVGFTDEGNEITISTPGIYRFDITNVSTNTIKITTDKPQFTR